MSAPSACVRACASHACVPAGRAVKPCQQHSLAVHVRAARGSSLPCCFVRCRMRALCRLRTRAPHLDTRTHAPHHRHGLALERQYCFAVRVAHVHGRPAPPAHAGWFRGAHSRVHRGCRACCRVGRRLTVRSAARGCACARAAACYDAIRSVRASCGAGGAVSCSRHSIMPPRSTKPEEKIFAEFIEMLTATNATTGVSIDTRVGSDATSMFYHMLTRIDPSFAPKDYTADDIIAALVSLQCPVAVRKSMLSSRGAPACSNVLEALRWLLSLLRYDTMLRFMAEADEAHPAADGQEFHWKYFTEAYDAFMSGEDAKVDAMDAEVHRAFGSW
ncbi:hypothetical protein EON67_01320 [archaeon]|nr:MAG: hypothetical protein EON67_01320 [archaeon]